MGLEFLAESTFSFAGAGITTLSFRLNTVSWPMSGILYDLFEYKVLRTQRLSLFKGLLPNYMVNILQKN